MRRTYRDKGRTPSLGAQSVRLLKMPRMHNAGQLMACFQYQRDDFRMSSVFLAWIPGGQWCWGEGWGFVDGIRRSGMARGGFVIAKWVDNGLSLSEFPTWWSGMELIAVTGETGWLGEKKWGIGTGLWKTPTRMFGEEGELTWPVPQWRLWGTLSKPLSAVTPWVVQRGFLLEYKETMLSQASACEKWAEWNNGKAMTFSSPRESWALEIT